MNWSEVDDATVRKLFLEDGLSYSRIARLYDDATIGMVAGRCRRLGLQRGTSKTLGVKKAKPLTEPKEAAEQALRVVAVREEPARPGSMKLEDLDAQACRWPFGDPRDKDFGFCGKTKHGDTSYCTEHLHRAHNPAAYYKRKTA